MTGRGAGLVVSAFLLAGCGDGGASASPETSAGVRAEPADPPAVTATTSRKLAVSPSGEAVPARTAGALTARSLPQPAELGRGWRGYADPGGHEEGFEGNGTWVRQRDPRDVVAGLRPVGCARPMPTVAPPAPRFALEGTYRGTAGAWGVSLMMQLASPEDATAALAALQRTLRACGDRAPGSLRIRVLSSSADAMADRRRDPDVPGRTSTEVVVRRGDRVGLLLVTPAAGKIAATALLERSLRTAIGRG